MKPGTRIDQYKIIRALGHGGMGYVYLATDTKLNRQVALKLISSDKSTDADVTRRFLHEAKAQANINHPNVATFYDIQESGTLHYIVMEYVEGRSLAEVSKEEKLKQKDIVGLMIEVGEGLAAAHSQGVIHRDIKPTNVMITSDNRAKILDFGLAKLKGASTLTKTGTTMGTASYMSPEPIL